MDEVDYRFQEWLTCPACEEVEDIGVLAHSTDIVIECYECGVTDEYTIGADVPVTNLDADAIEDVSREG